MSGAYSALGGVFEYLNDDCGYEEWSQYLIKRLCGLGVSDSASGVDLGCGNGYFTRAMQRGGFKTVGVDLSPEMLTRAVELSRKEGLKPDYIAGDAAKLALNFKPDFVIAVNDCFNYVEGGKLLSAFKRIYKALKPNGVFIFDVSSEYKLRNIIGDNLFAEDRGDAAYTWFNTLKDDRVEMDITLFVRRKDGLYERRDEAQTQYIHSKDKIIFALEEAGFACSAEGHLGGELAETSERINFVCVKKG